MEFIYDEEPEYPFLNELSKCVVQFINISVALTITFFLIRIAELFIFTNLSLVSDLGRVISVSLLHELIFIARILALLFFPFVLLYFNIRNKKVVYLIFGICGLLILVLELVLIIYNYSGSTLFGTELFKYSFTEITQFYKNGVAIDLSTITLFIVPLIFFWILLLFTIRRQFIGAHSSLFILLACMLILFTGISAVPANNKFNTEHAYTLSINK
ncbi:MAG TPA: hypothetical protein VGD31_13120, partial [Sphingobacteriaceae bacterium]